MKIPLLRDDLLDPYLAQLYSLILIISFTAITLVFLAHWLLDLNWLFLGYAISLAFFSQIYNIIYYVYLKTDNLLSLIVPSLLAIFIVWTTLVILGLNSIKLSAAIILLLFIFYYIVIICSQVTFFKHHNISQQIFQKSIWYFLKENNDYLKYEFPRTFIQSIFVQAAFWVMYLSYPKEIAGIYFTIERTLKRPMRIAAKPIGDYIYRSTKLDKEMFGTEFLRIHNLMFLIVVSVSLLSFSLLLFLEDMINVIFENDISQILFPILLSALLILIFSTNAHMAKIVNKMKLGLQLNIMRDICILCYLIFSAITFNISIVTMLVGLTLLEIILGTLVYINMTRYAVDTEKLNKVKINLFVLMILYITFATYFLERF